MKRARKDLFVALWASLQWYFCFTSLSAATVPRASVQAQSVTHVPHSTIFCAQPFCPEHAAWKQRPLQVGKLEACRHHLANSAYYIGYIQIISKIIYSSVSMLSGNIMLCH